MRQGYRRHLAGLVAAVLLALAGWVGVTLVNNTQRVTAVEVRVESLKDWMQRVDAKLERLLERR